MRSRSLLLAVSCVAAAGAAQALPLGDRASVEVFAGAQDLAGTFGEARDSSSAAAGSIHADRIDLDDAYHHRFTSGAELDYALDRHASASARFGYSQFDGTNRVVAHEISGEATTTPVNARFGDTATRELDLGARYAFMPDAKLNPFVGIGLGAERMSPLRASVGEAANAPKVELAAEDTVFTQRVETGVQYSPARNFGVRLTVAADHVDGQRGSDDPNLALLGLHDTNGNLHAHWDYPAELGAVWKF